MDDDALCDLPATRLAAMLRAREVSAREVVAAHVARVERDNPSVNAIVTFTPDRALEHASAADDALARGAQVGALHGLPVAHKDLQETAGIRTTYGSAVYADHVPVADSLLVRRVREAGGISLGKTNTPEFGTGSQTYNAVFGATRNPYDLSRTCGGSSGGAAVSLAAGFVALADGSDMGGSLRNPASFCNVVGLRPAAGRVPDPDLGWFTLAVDGPMARTVADTALLLSVIAGDDASSPIALPGDGSEFRFDPADVGPRGTRVGWCSELPGVPVAREVRAVLDDRGLAAMGDLGTELTHLTPDFTGADEAFRVWRGWFYAKTHGRLVDEHRDLVNESVVANVEYGRGLTAEDLARADDARSDLWARMCALFDDVDVLALPVSQVAPFPVEQRWVSEIEGQPLDSYLDWMRSAYWVSATGLPAMSVPCGFTPDGLPVGLQLVGRPRGERDLLRFAHAVEQACGASSVRPTIPAAGGGT